MLKRIGAVLAVLVFAALAQAQTQFTVQPDCQLFFTFTGAGTLPHAANRTGTNCADNRSAGIISWVLTYNNSGFSPVSIQVESAANNGGSPGSYSAGFPNGTVVTGTNPLTSTTAGFVVIQGYNAWVQVNLSTATGSGVISGALYGWKVPSAAAGPGTGGLDQLTQDVLAGPGSGSQPATVVGINTVPLCAGFSPTNGQVLQYTTGLSPNPCYTAASGGSGPPASVKVLGSDSGSSFVAATANDLGSVSYVAGAGTAQAQTATLAPAVGSLVAGSTRLCWLPAHANSGAGPTMAVNGLAAKTIVKSGGAALVASDLTTTAVACVIYDGTDFELQNPQTASGTGGLDQLTQDVLAGPGSGSQPATVVGINTVPLCAGFSPTNGQVLQYTTGLSPNPCYTAAAPASGALVLLEEHTASSSAELDFTSFYSATYDVYVIELLYLIPDTGSTALQLQYSTDGGSSYDSTGGHYSWAEGYGGTSASPGVNVSSSDSSIQIVGSLATGAANTGVSGSIKIYIPTTSTSPTNLLTDIAWWPTGGSVNVYRAWGVGAYTPTTAVNALRLKFSSGNIATGIARVYGLTH